MLNVLSDGILLEDSETQKLLQECKTIFWETQANLIILIICYEECQKAKLNPLIHLILVQGSKLLNLGEENKVNFLEDRGKP